MEVVAAAVLDDGRVLAARRVRPAGGWEFPGGKVEAGEAPATAIERECLEELGVTVRAIAPLAVFADDRIELQLWHVEVVAGSPTAMDDHDELRWLDRDHLDDVEWLPADRGLLAAVRDLLDGRAERSAEGG